jgi:hypothetical protein
MEHILKWFTNFGGSDALKYVIWFDAVFNPSDFRGMDSLFACFLKYCAKLGIVPCRRYLDTYIKIDCKGDIRKYNIKPDDNDVYDYKQISQLDSAYEVIKTTVGTLFDMYMQEDLTDREFKLDMYEYMNDMKAVKITEAINSVAPDISNRLDVSAASEKLRANLVRIEEVYNIDSLNELDSITSDDGNVKMNKLTDTGIPAIDGDIGGIYTRLIYTVNAQPAGGKTRFVLVHFIYRVMLCGFSCILFSTELTKVQVKNILIAHHIAQKFGKKIPDSAMNKGELNPEQKALYDTANIELFESGKYGSLYIIEECIVEQLSSKVTALLKSDKTIRLMTIDYMGLIKSKPEDRRSKLVGYEIITEGYIVTRDLLKKNDIAAVCINQYNDEGIAAASAGKPIRSGHVQGGHIVNRHTDYDLSITYTEEQKLANLRTLLNTKPRGSGGFKPVQLRTDLSISMFKQEVI